MDCILFRHGIAVDRGEWTGDDRSRPLTGEGVEITRHVTQGLVRLGVVPTSILCSPFLRTRQTADIVRDILGVSERAHPCPALLSEAAPEDFLNVLTSYARDECVFCVGHEPHLGQTAGLMLLGQPVTGLSFTTSGVCRIRFDGTPRPGCGTLQWWLPPAFFSTPAHR